MCDSVCFRGHLGRVLGPPKSPMPRVVYKATYASPGVARKGRVCVVWLVRSLGVRLVDLGWAKCEFQPPGRHRKGFFFHPSFYVKVGVIVLHIIVYPCYICARFEFVVISP